MKKTTKKTDANPPKALQLKTETVLRLVTGGIPTAPTSNCPSGRWCTACGPLPG